ncbi:hypothetical protein STIAU_4738 [Stigmatella aurantiaca DW4/3-1]|uniref:Uncharacterized protein n=1 Tax=Stigmatella aurantiaca (strain DW4/3-1) TaxID=378806 RepID=Q08NH4_STIAD|nr:hypothetical protein STIAU_4738 [Stigmatella aurantiaca DW4/3-1]
MKRGPNPGFTGAGPGTKIAAKAASPARWCASPSTVRLGAGCVNASDVRLSMVVAPPARGGSCSPQAASSTVTAESSRARDTGPPDGLLAEERRDVRLEGVLGLADGFLGGLDFVRGVGVPDGLAEGLGDAGKGSDGIGQLLTDPGIQLRIRVLHEIGQRRALGRGARQVAQVGVLHAADVVGEVRQRIVGELALDELRVLRIIGVGDLPVGHFVEDVDNPSHHLLARGLHGRVGGVAGVPRAREHVPVGRTPVDRLGPGVREGSADVLQLQGDGLEVLELPRREVLHRLLGARAGVAREEEVFHRVEALQRLLEVAHVLRGEGGIPGQHRVQVRAVHRPAVHGRIIPKRIHRSEEEAFALLPRHPGSEPGVPGGGEALGAGRRRERVGGGVQGFQPRGQLLVGGDDHVVGEVNDDLLVEGAVGGPAPLIITAGHQHERAGEGQGTKPEAGEGHVWVSFTGQ